MSDKVSERLHATVAMALADEPSRVTPENVLGAIREEFLIIPRAELKERLNAAKIAGTSESRLIGHTYAFRSNEEATEIVVRELRRMQG